MGERFGVGGFGEGTTINELFFLAIGNKEVRKKGERREEGGRFGARLLTPFPKASLF